LDFLLYDENGNTVLKSSSKHYACGLNKKWTKKKILKLWWST
jgi:hypothetical protein